MENIILSESSIGEIYLCRKCNNIHLACGNFVTSFTTGGFQELGKMIAQAEKTLRASGRQKESLFAEKWGLVN